MVAFALPAHVADVTRPAERLNFSSRCQVLVTVLGVSAAAWGVLMAAAPLLQIRRMMARRSAQDVSVGYFVVLLPGFALWVLYGTVRADWALVVPNSIAVLVTSTTVVATRRLRHRYPGRPAAGLTSGAPRRSLSGIPGRDRPA